MSTLIKIVQGPLGGQYARIERSGEPGEKRVRFFKDGQHLTEADYFTDDMEDAEGTAKAQMNKLPVPEGWSSTDWTPYEETSLKQAPVPTQTVGSLSPKAFDVATWELEAYWKAKEGHRARHGVYPPNVFDFLSLHFRQDGTWSMVAPLCACPDGKRPAWEGFSPKQTYLEEKTIHDIALAICIAHNLPAIVICGRNA